MTKEECTKRECYFCAHYVRRYMRPVNAYIWCGGDCINDEVLKEKKRREKVKYRDDCEYWEFADRSEKDNVLQQSFEEISQRLIKIEKLLSGYCSSKK